MKKNIKVTLGYKYRIYPNLNQKKILNHHMFIYNQTYNICINLLKSHNSSSDYKYLKSTDIDTKVKSILNNRNLKFSRVVTQQARINFEKNLRQYDKGFPKFKKSGTFKDSFNWNNQNYSIINTNNSNIKILRIMRQDIKLKYHRELPCLYKMNQLSFSKNNNKYYVSFSITYFKEIEEISIHNLDKSKSVGIDLNVSNIALSNGQLIKTDSIEISKKKYNKRLIRLKRKQSRRILKYKKSNQPIGINFKKTQLIINKTMEKISNTKKDKYNKITSQLVNKFDLVSVENLNIKKMTKRSSFIGVRQKSKLNKAILNTSFYLLLSQLKYKTTHNGKLFTKIDPSFTSKKCCECGQINYNLKLNHKIFKCECGNIKHRDINASKNIHYLGLKSFGLGISLADYNSKVFHLNSIEFIS